MSNIFKSNSRFSALLDDTKDVKKDRDKDRDRDRDRESKNKLNKDGLSNSFKSSDRFSEKKETRFRPYNEKERQQHKLEKEQQLNAQKEFKKKEKEQLVLEALSMDNFPELISVSKKENNEKSHASYMDILKKEEELKAFTGDPDLVDLEPGWLLIKKDTQTGNTIMKYGLGTVFYEEPKKSENELLLDAVDALIELHEKRTEEYIELNGYDVWEKMFKYPNWEEREAYLEEEDETDDSSEENDDEYHDEYYDEYYDDYYDNY